MQASLENYHKIWTGQSLKIVQKMGKSVFKKSVRIYLKNWQVSLKIIVTIGHFSLKIIVVLQIIITIGQVRLRNYHTKWAGQT